MTRPCVYCDLPLHFVSGKGWVHPQGKTVVMACPDCGWVGEQPAERITFQTDVCPRCGVQGKLGDDHVAMPAATPRPPQN